MQQFTLNSVTSSNFQYKRIRFLRYAGGKQRLLKYIVPHFPECNKIKGIYLEPFVGGGSVLFAYNPDKAIISDINKELINLYVAIKKNYKKVWKIFKNIPGDKESYYRIRGQNFKTIFKSAARTLYLNRSCFKGMWRHNSYGMFNVGYGGKDRLNIITEYDLEQISMCLKNVKIICSDFEDIINNSTPEDFIFLDPPYCPGKKEMKNPHFLYDQFSFNDYIRLSNSLSKATGKGIKWLLITSSNKDIMHLFKNYSIRSIPMGTGDRPGILTFKPKEVIITNYI